MADFLIVHIRIVNNYKFCLQRLASTDKMQQHKQSQISEKQSRISSSSSSTSQNYELMPREQPFSNMTRDLPSPRASFPFKKVQPGFETAIANKSHNVSRSSDQSSSKRQKQDSRQMFETIADLTLPKPSTQKREERRQQSRPGSTDHSECQAKIKELQQKLNELESTFQRKKMDFEYEKKANEIYNQGFKSIREVLNANQYILEGEGVDQVVEKVKQIVISVKKAQKEPIIHINHGQQAQKIIDEQDRKIRDLRAELLKSSENNINAIFNTEITEAHCLHLQIKKMNGQIVTLKENLTKVNSQNKITVHHQNSSDSKSTEKIVNVYHHHQRNPFEQDHQHQQYLQKTKRKREGTQYEQKVRSVQTQRMMSQLEQGYSKLKQQYLKIQQLLKSLTTTQLDSRQHFTTLKQQIHQTLQQQMLQAKQTLLRPSSSHSQKKTAKDIEAKLNHLINTLNGPQRVNVQRNVGEESVNEGRNVEMERKWMELEYSRDRLSRENQKLKEEKQLLEERLIQQVSQHKKQLHELQSHHQNPSKSYHRSHASPKPQHPHFQLDQFLISRSDLKQQEIIQQFSGIDPNGIIYTSSMNKVHSSQSYHHSSSKYQENQNNVLSKKFQQLRECIREKDLRIFRLEQAMFEHLQQSKNGKGFDKDSIIEKYQLYLNNLKMLLNDSQKQNELLKEKLIKYSQMSISRANDPDHNSVTLSDRTTKHPITQTRMIQGRSNESSQLKIYITEEFEKIFMRLLDLYDKALMLQEQSSRQFGHCMFTWIQNIISLARDKSNRVFQYVFTKENVKRVLRELGFH